MSLMYLNMKMQFFTTPRKNIHKYILLILLKKIINKHKGRTGE